MTPEQDDITGTFVIPIDNGKVIDELVPRSELEAARADNARLREALGIARKHLLNSDGFYFGPLNKTVIRSGTTQGGIERTQDGYPIGGITIHNYGQAVVQEMDTALATNETGAQE